MNSVSKIQEWMKENNKDIFLINRTDEFLSEYIAPYAERLKWISNFSGSAGRAIIENGIGRIVKYGYCILTNLQIIVMIINIFKFKIPFKYVFSFRVNTI